ncbi:MULTISPECIES: DUF1622 domain-containing protein [Mycobacterium]|uniref:DUF1622 domain-containing protein n=1 Tax=Mycobacterium kiyosense TaxID=2871094 RepID=A0A9P3Q7G5_9MYCO|nr:MULTISPECIES: DUF1622 domain-containing protein [Mycobacterium]BDB42019.1 hypothetical protein IWGMT90018_24650 [Mycobacterium kiyosense]BDE14698.1 hypothetical protein MKCMC460_35580 [Mycobacterium sp. 20KCMC460]GLB81383.1 hypothetical protein SRL2020028_06390 [Mycobacterium kiyosense]GLB90920.1 hypothetical protein SRL2020130_37370 [Mycobacterium kiyosense]GLB97204.1 hypothetical protein SRL2020226_39800 [Mycobacterium kiyosense]
MTYIQIVDRIGAGIDGVGVAVIILGAVNAIARFLSGALRKQPQAYQQLRVDLGRAILVGLEFLVAGDIIRTIVVTPTGQSVAVLAGVVAIRTFLSISLTVEMTGRWPWRRDEPRTPDPA